ncbi:MAG: hypothetical protein K9L57_09610 [Spirochaetaceae bacterium]|nr:hypothetical protein [Spirochaetia bacterium]MCF7951877.1 hypothetical protein [Spirochaetaceae bacterium]
MTSQQAQDLIGWIKEQAKDIHFGEIGIVLKFHDGQLRYIEKTSKVTEQPGTKTAPGEKV